MSKQLIVLQPPAFGEPCNGCGQCCREELCEFGIGAFGDIHAPCPALRERGGRTFCGVIEEAEKMDTAFAAHLKWRLGIGCGCDADFGKAGPRDTPTRL